MKTVEIAVLGHGTIGKGVYDTWKRNSAILNQNTGVEIHIKKILVMEAEKAAKPELKEDPTFVTNVEEIFSDRDISIVVELIGGEHPAVDFMLAAMDSGKSVVSANKMAIAKHLEELTAKAEEKGVYFLYEASVGGGIPILRMMNESLEANEILSVMGIMNGTSNYILSKMTKEGMDFEKALAIAKEKGYAEADPTSDVGGYDTLYKLAILSSLSFDTRVHYADIYREGIDKISKADIASAALFGYVIKLLAIGKREGDSLELRVHPTMIHESHPLAHIDDAYNAIYVTGNEVEDIMVTGKGAGASPTSSAVWSDILAVIKGEPKRKIGTLPFRVRAMGENTLPYYIRFHVKDRPGVLGEVCDIFGVYGVGIRSVSQHPKEDETQSDVDIIFVTHPAQEEAVQKAVLQIQELSNVDRMETLIRIEEA